LSPITDSLGYTDTLGEGKALQGRVTLNYFAGEEEGAPAKTQRLS